MKGWNLVSRDERDREREREEVWWRGSLREGQHHHGKTMEEEVLPDGYKGQQTIPLSSLVRRTSLTLGVLAETTERNQANQGTLSGRSIVVIGLEIVGLGLKILRRPRSVLGMPARCRANSHGIASLISLLKLLSLYNVQQALTLSNQPMMGFLNVEHL
jgi:hypothetical protein